MPFIDDLKKKAQQWAQRQAEKIKQSTLYYLPGEMAETAARIGPKIPIIGKPLEIMGKGLATAISLPFVQKTQREIEEREREAQAKLLETFQKTKDPQKKEKIKEILTTQRPINLYEEVLKEAPTEKQVVGAATELATLAALGKIGKATLKAPKYIKYPLEVAKSALTTGTLAGAVEAQRKEATAEDILREAKKGAKVGAVVTTALLGAGELLPRVGKAISRQWQKAVKWAEKELAKEIPAKSQIDETLKTIDPKLTLSQRVAKKVLGVEEFLSKIPSRLIDKNYSFTRIENKIAQVRGRPLKEYEKVARDARLLYSIADFQAEDDIVKLLNKISPLDDTTRKKALAYLAQLDYIERAKLGQPVPGGKTLEELQKGLQKIIEEIGPDDMPKVEAVRQAFQEHFKTLLDRRVEAGVISKELRDKLLATHPNYLPHYVLDEIDEKAYQFIKDSMNVSHSDIMRAFGSTKEIKDPFVATIRKTIIANRVIEKNKLLNNLARTFRENADLFPGAGEISRTAEVPPGFGKVNYLVNGEVKTLAVPKDLEVAIKNLDRPLTPTWFRFLTFPQRIFKKFSTQLNPSFTIPNKFRDVQTSAITSASFIDEVAKKYGTTPLGINIDALTPKEIERLYRQSGGWGASIFMEGDPDYIFSKLTKAGIGEKIGNLNPIKLFETINDKVEVSTRLEVFKQALKQGLSLKDAALVAREATIDFAKMGSWMEPLNRAIPFLNARVQGFVNIASSFFKNPEVFARTINWITTYPAIMLHAHNRRFESYKNISQYLKNRYWVIMVGETDGIDPYTGEVIRVPQFITIPKSEGQQLIASPIQWYLEQEDKTDRRKIDQLIIDIVGETSPIWFQTYNSQDWLLSLVGQMGPAISVPAGLIAKKHPFYGTPLVPKEREEAPAYLQYTKTTPRILRWATERLAAAKILNVSPAKIDFVLSSLGGFVEDVIDALDVAFGKITKQPTVKRSITETPFGTATQIPVLRRFLREATGRGSSEQIYRQEQKRKIEEKVIERKLKEKEKAEEIWNELIRKRTPEEKFNYLKELRDKGELTAEIFDRLKALKRARTTVEELRVNDPVEVRALYIWQRLNEMRQENASEEEIFEYLRELRDKKILTNDVMKYLEGFRRVTTGQ